MKKGLLVLSVASASIFATSLYYTDIDKGVSELTRQMPNSNGTVLSYYDAVKEAKKAVVNISTQKTVKAARGNGNPFMNDPFFREFFGGFNFEQMVPKDRVERSLGSGVIINTDGYIITNNHVIDGADKILVSVSGDKKEYMAKLIGSDPKSDIAVIKIEGDKFPFINFADSTKVKEGDVVFAIGNPFGVGETVTHGIVSALNKHGIGINEYENFIQTDAPINPGNSGGALIDSRGALVGINTAILSKSGASNGIGFAIPSNQARKLATMIVEKGKVERGFLGVTLQDLTPELQKFYSKTQGCVIVKVSKDSPAGKGGVKDGDLVVALNGKAIADSSELKNLVGESTPGSKVELTIVRGKKELKLLLTLAKFGSHIASETSLIEGVTLSELGLENRKKYAIPENILGVVVTSVEEKADTALVVGDVIYQIEDILVNSLSDVENAMKANEGDKRVLLYRRGFQKMTVVR